MPKAPVLFREQALLHCLLLISDETFLYDVSKSICRLAGIHIPMK